MARLPLQQTGLKPGQPQGSAVPLIQRFGSVANLDVHLHGLLLDGVYRLGDGVPVFVPAPPPTVAQIEAMRQAIIGRLMRLLVRRGVLVHQNGPVDEERYADGYLTDGAAVSEEARALRPLQAARVTYRIAFGPRAGQKVLTLKEAGLREAVSAALCVDYAGFSLHAAVRCGAHERQALERLRPYITRPALASDRVQTNGAGQVVLRLKTPWRDGNTHVVIPPLVFMQRLAALTPRPRVHLICCRGMLAPSAKLRALVIRAPLWTVASRGVSEEAGEDGAPCWQWSMAHELGTAFDAGRFRLSYSYLMFLGPPHAADCDANDDAFAVGGAGLVCASTGWVAQSY